jgi:hypothetical protein
MKFAPSFQTSLSWNFKIIPAFQLLGVTFILLEKAWISRLGGSAWLVLQISRSRQFSPTLESMEMADTRHSEIPERYYK